VYSSIYCADDQMLVSQHAYGVPAAAAAVLHLKRADGADMGAAYLDAFETAGSDPGSRAEAGLAAYGVVPSGTAESGRGASHGQGESSCQDQPAAGS
jgi:hypothetical protein